MTQINQYCFLFLNTAVKFSYCMWANGIEKGIILCPTES
ncbi:hypothetical protein SK34_03327 [Citrobacter sp. MGH104]|nr:hypothetical protein SK34_03327 [Citrobacter sp. MGH104]